MVEPASAKGANALADVQAGKGAATPKPGKRILLAKLW